MSSLKWIVEKVEELNEDSAKTELAFILQRFSEIGPQGYSQEDFIKDVKEIYINLGLDRY